MLESHWSLAPDMELFTDASNLGYGAFWAGKWLSEPWPPSQQHFSIAWKELYTILVACSTWGWAWQRKRILFHCDNAAVVSIWQRGSSKCRDLMGLVRSLFFLAATGNCHVSIAHIPGVQLTTSHVSPCRPSGSGGPSPHTDQHPCTSDGNLTAHLHHLQLLGITQSTRRTYQAGVNRF